MRGNATVSHSFEYSEVPLFSPVLSPAVLNFEVRPVILVHAMANNGNYVGRRPGLEYPKAALSLAGD